MTHPYQRIAAKRRAEGKLASKKEIAAIKNFYELGNDMNTKNFDETGELSNEDIRDMFADPEDDAAIIRVNRGLVLKKFFYENGHCKKHNNKDCLYCLDMLRGD